MHEGFASMAGRTPTGSKMFQGIGSQERLSLICFGLQLKSSSKPLNARTDLLGTCCGGCSVGPEEYPSVFESYLSSPRAMEVRPPKKPGSNQTQESPAPKKSCYEILGVARPALPSVIEKAYDGSQRGS